ncbi:MAG TPA: aromatic amino acid ammonia-lyase [Microvirga sp.]|jgi:histidine ammonia-lyase|nr:aromatic amino acid ammonia-lyase [Microvirga sp.]
MDGPYLPVISLDGKSLTLQALWTIAEARAGVSIADNAGATVTEARQRLEVVLQRLRPVYGATTSVGAFKDMRVGSDDIMAFNRRLIHSHYLAMGDALDPTVVRAAMVIRLNTILTGHSGASLRSARAIADLINAGIVPVVRNFGSIGCADVGQMSAIAAALLGDGEVLYRDRVIPAGQALVEAGLERLNPAQKDALVLISTNALSVGAIAVALQTLRRQFWAQFAAFGISAAAFGASRQPWRAAAEIAPDEARNMGRFLLNAFADDRWIERNEVHDPLSYRFMPQIAGAALHALAAAEAELESMCNTSDDNPVVIGDEVYASGGSLPLQLTLSIEKLMLAVAHLGRALFNRVVMLCRDDITGLPRNLAPPHGAAIGFGAATKLAADLFLTLMDEASPSSLHPTTVANGLEDEATNLPIIGRKLARQIDALGKLIAFESVAGLQGVRLRGNRDQLLGLAGRIAERVDPAFPPLEDDRMLSYAFSAAEQAVCEPAWADALRESYPYPVPAN